MSQLLDLYKQMFLIRSTEQYFLKSYSIGKMKGTVHTCYGQEGTAVGVLSEIDKEKDIVFSNHRGHGHFLAYTYPQMPYEGFISEVLAAPTGICKGLGGSQHLQWKNFYSNGIQGGITPIAVGCALAEKHKKSDAISIVFLGDGTMGEGAVYESLNFSSAFDIPTLFVLENNRYAQTTPVQTTHRGEIHTRANGFGIESKKTDGNNVITLKEEVAAITKKMRAEKRPFFLELDTYRLGPHSKGDDFRDKAEIEAQKKICPLEQLKKELKENDIKSIEEEVSSFVDTKFKEVWEQN